MSELRQRTVANKSQTKGNSGSRDVDDDKHLKYKHNNDASSVPLKYYHAARDGSYNKALNSLDSVIFYIFTFLSFATRCIGLHHPHVVVFDEVHFGKFSAHYIARKYFFDVHPPLGKLIFALQGYLAGFDGGYLFNEIGEDYLTAYKNGPIPYVEYRLGPAICGSLLVPMTYTIVKDLGGGTLAAIIASSLLLLDNAHVTQTRLILLDSYLVFFIIGSVMCWTKFCKYNNSISENDDNKGSNDRFTAKWWLSLLFTGVFISCSLGVKMVGLFVIAQVGLHTIVHLYKLYTDVKIVSIPIWFKNFVARVLALIIVPVLLFLGMFYVHFEILNKSGPGDSHMTKQFQATLLNSRHYIEPNSTLAQPEYVAIGSKIRIAAKDKDGDVCYLHSHYSRWPVNYDGRVTSGQQQVTCYGHQDQNNLWIALPATLDALSFVRDGIYKDKVSIHMHDA